MVSNRCQYQEHDSADFVSSQVLETEGKCVPKSMINLAPILKLQVEWEEDCLFGFEATDLFVPSM